MIKVGLPPNFDQIVAAFPHAVNPRTIFAFGDDIYNPSGIELPQPMLMHEYEHCVHQFARAEQWWTKYIEDHEFRYYQELLAHVAEYICSAGRVKDRNARARMLMVTARRLIAPLYNYSPPRTLPQAMRDISALVELV